MIDSYFRAPYQKYFLDPIVRIKKIAAVHPSSITLAALLSGLCIPLSLCMDRSYLAIFFLCLTGFFDTLDGSVARATNRISHKGALLDILSDRAVEFFVMVGLYLYDPSGRAFFIIGMLGASYLCVTSFLTVAIFTQNDGTKSFHYSPGFMERAEAFLFYLLMIWVPSHFSWLSITYILLVSITALVRTVEFTRK